VKRFQWPLQRLLNVTRQRELARRAELLGLFREMARVRQEIVHRKRIILVSLNELGRHALQERIPRQEVVMSCSAVRQKEIDRLQERLEAMESELRQKTDQFIKTKKVRENLEKMRERAKQTHLREQLKLEQKALDESAHVSFARRPGSRADR